MSDYAELHCHSSFSFLDGASDPEELAAVAVRRGLRALAITDHGGLYGAVRFAQAARAFGLPSIFGAEVTLGSAEERTGVLDPSGDHLVVLARNPDGYAQLSTVLADAHLRGGKKGQPQISMTELAAANRGDWWVLTGCRKGPLSRSLSEYGPSAARDRLRDLIDLFGVDSLAVEIWDHGHPLDSARNDALALLAASAGVALVATNNVHYATTHDFYLAQSFAALRARRSLEEMEGWLPPAPTALLRSPHEQQRRMARWPGSVETAVAIGLDSAFDLRLVAPQLPRFPCPPGLDEQGYLRQLTEERAAKRYGTRDDERVPGAWLQIDHELEVIEVMGFAGYFLTVWDITEFCRRSNIYCQGRGSAANSAVCFSLGITNADAVRLGLFFERFLSPARDGPPDIDIDIESGRREEVIQYVYERYGRRHAAQVANVITYRSRSALRDMGRVLGYSEEEVTSWSKAATDPETSIPDSVALLARHVLNRPRHLGIHSAGMVICDRPIVEVCPVEWGRTPGRSVLQWDKDDCAGIGLVKFDLLGLGMLEALHRMVDLIGEHHGVTLDLGELPQEDAVYDLLCRADTLGVFQVESRAQMGTLPRVEPRCFYDLVIEVALIRPGPIQGGSVHPYIRRRRGEEPVTYLHPRLEPILKRTLGVPLFQEQLMEMAVAIAGFSAAQADELRQAMASKRSVERMAALKERLYAGMAGYGIEGADADEIYTTLSAFANFGFPESHSVSFAHLVYCSAWIKQYYPAAFTAALLNAQPMGFWSPQSLIADAQRHGVVIARPDVQRSQAQARLEGRSDKPVLRLGLSSVRGISRDVATKIAEGAPWLDQEDLVRRAGVTRANLEALSIAGALDGFGASRRSLLWSAGAAAQATPDRLPGVVIGTRAPDLIAASAPEQVNDDLWALGMTPEATAISLLREELTQLGVVTAASLPNTATGKVRVAGAVTHRQHPETAKGAVFINLEDETGHVNVIFSKGAWQRWKPVARHNPLLLVHGRLERAQGAITVVAERVESLGQACVVPSSRDFR
jgi:error-prone DNA polymerase